MNSPFTLSRIHVRLFSLALFVIAAGGLMSACTTTTRVSADFDRSARFDGYRTYAWMARDHHDRHNPLIARFARESIDAELGQRGFVLVSDPAAADFEVDFTIGARDRIDVNTYPVRYRGPWAWGYGYYGREVDLRQYREGTLAIDIFDGRTHQPVWTGRATKEITRADQLRSDGPIRVATSEVLAQFPPRLGSERPRSE
jgi:hypothetical protein